VSAPTPDEIYERTREEGTRRLSRPFLELAATAFVAGLDVVFGVIALGLTVTSEGVLATGTGEAIIAPSCYARL
jgi:formate/nitrite transporter FocA (FNT family)